MCLVPAYPGYPGLKGRKTSVVVPFNFAVKTESVMFCQSELLFTVISVCVLA